MSERCPNCGIPVGPMPEDAANDEMLCNSCYETFEAEQNKAYLAEFVTCPHYNHRGSDCPMVANLMEGAPKQ